MEQQLPPSQLVVETSINMETALKRYLIYLKADKKSPATQEKYLAHLNALREWLHDRGVDSPKQIKRYMLEEWIAELYEQWATATVRQAIAAVRSFNEWCYDGEWIKKKQKEKLAKALKLPNVEDRVQRTLTTAEFEALLAACDLTTAKGKRDAALISLLLDSGLRASEVCCLRADDVEYGLSVKPNVRANRVTVVVKGNKIKYGYFGEQAAQHVQAWQQARGQIVANPAVKELFVFLGGTKPGTRLSRDGLRTILRKLAKKAGIKHLSPHSFRRGFACILEMAGASTRTIQELGRWEELEMALLDTKDYRAAEHYNRYCPVDYIYQLED